MTQLEPAMALTQTVQTFLALPLEPNAHIVNFNRVAETLHLMAQHVALCELSGMTSEDIHALLAPAKEIFLQSWFLDRCTTWPRGYPGDFETIEYFYRAQNRSTPETLAFYTEEYALLCASTQQHVNKLHFQAQLVRDLALFGPSASPHASDSASLEARTLRVLSIASGNSLDLQHILPILRGKDIEFVLNDTDPDALESAKEKLAPIAGQCQFLPGNPIELLAWEGEELGKFDLILLGGLFDYLANRHITFLLKQAYNTLLRPYGRVFFTNIAPGNPYRHWMGYFTNWTYIERTEEDLLALLVRSGFSREHADIQRDRSRLTCLVTATLFPSEEESL